MFVPPGRSPEGYPTQAPGATTVGVAQTFVENLRRPPRKPLPWVADDASEGGFGVGSTLHNLVAGVKARGETVRLRLETGHELVVSVRAFDQTWLSGETTGHEPRGVVVPFRSIVCLWATDGAAAGTTPGDGSRGLDVPLAMLGRLSKAVTVHGLRARHQGVIVHAGEDYLVLYPEAPPPVVIPYSAISWVAVV